MSYFLDKTGLTTVWSKINSLFLRKKTIIGEDVKQQRAVAETFTVSAASTDATVYLHTPPVSGTAINVVFDNALASFTAGTNGAKKDSDSGLTITYDGDTKLYGTTETGNFDSSGTITITVQYTGYAPMFRFGGNATIDGALVEPRLATLSGKEYKPYFESGDTVYFDNLRTAGYVTNAKGDIWFTVPLAKPVVGISDYEAVSLTWNDGMMVRDVTGKYSHGSTYTTSANEIKPSTFCQLTGKDSDGTYSAVRVRCQPSSTANATNNAPCGIEASFTLTFG